MSLRKRQTLATSVASRSVETSFAALRSRRCRTLSECLNHSAESAGQTLAYLPGLPVGRELSKPESAPSPAEIDPLYLFACHMEWERSEDLSAGWELIAAAQSSEGETRAHARALLSKSAHLGGCGLSNIPGSMASRKQPTAAETDMTSPYGLEIIENCSECTCMKSEFFCGVSREVLQSLNHVSYKNTLPAGAILFVEGQAPRGMFIVCSGKVNLSTTSRDGKNLILKTAQAGEAIGLAAAISGMPYETTAETATPCQLNFVDRKHFMELMATHSEIGVHTAQHLSRDYQTAYRDLHGLVLTRSSEGKLARLLLSQARGSEMDTAAPCRTAPMTHEEMAQRIGSSRETVTRLLATLRRRQLIRLDGPGLVIRDRIRLEALTV